MTITSDESRFATLDNKVMTMTNKMEKTMMEMQEELKNLKNTTTTAVKANEEYMREAVEFIQTDQTKIKETISEIKQTKDTFERRIEQTLANNAAAHTADSKNIMDAHAADNKKVMDVLYSIMNNNNNNNNNILIRIIIIIIIIII